jgi:type II secretory pathway pseudopilin PulG
MARAGQGGFTYLVMLLAVAVIGLGLTATAEVWSVSNQRVKERELLFVGREIRNAIKSYAQATPGPVPRFPAKLDDLLQDNRYPGVKRHLRKLYRDPMTGAAEWGLIQAPGGGVQGVYSLSDAKPIKTSAFDYEDRALEGATSYQGWRFVHEPASVPAAAPAPAAAAPAAPAPSAAAPPAAALGAPAAAGAASPAR